MSRLLFIIAIIAVIYWWVTSTRKQQQSRRDEPPSTEDMVRCAECGVHLPRSEGYLVGGKYYCSEAHSRSQTGKPD